MSLLSSIPISYKNKLENENIQLRENINKINNNLINKLIKTKETNKFLYSFQIKNDQMVQITSQEKRSSSFENETLKWDTIYLNINTSTIDTKLRNFQYKYLFRIIPTNKRLFLQNIVHSNLCDFCSTDIESIRHLFWECNHVQVFWNNLHNFINNTHIRININFQTISFGFCEETDDVNIKNYIIFYAKYFIFLNKCHKTIPSCDLFKIYLRRRIEIEKEIALMNDQLHKFEVKWRLFSTYL